MTCNVGKIDRVLRGVVGVAAIAWGATNGLSAFADTTSMVAGAVGAVLLFTAIIGWCPPYALLGVNTGCKTK